MRTVYKDNPRCVERNVELFDYLLNGCSLGELDEIGITPGSVGQVLGQGGKKIQFDFHKTSPKVSPREQPAVFYLSRE